MTDVLRESQGDATAARDSPECFHLTKPPSSLWVYCACVTVVVVVTCLEPRI